MNQNNEGVDNTFAMMLGQVDKGRLLSDLGQAQRECIAAVRETGAAATITVKLTFKPIKDTDGEQIHVLDDIKTKKPKPPRRASIFFTDEDGSLSRDYPKQRDWVEEMQEGAEGRGPGAEGEDKAAAGNN